MAERPAWTFSADELGAMCESVREVTDPTQLAQLRAYARELFEPAEWAVLENAIAEREQELAR